GQVPRDPRRRARLPHRQAVRGRLADAGPHAARGGGGPAQAAGPAPAATLGPAVVHSILAVLQVFLSVGVIFLVLLHSGKDAGMSGAFGVGAAGGTTGGSLMERNLDRWTILFAILFAANTLALLKT